MKRAEARTVRVRPARTQPLVIFALLATTLLFYVPLGRLSFISYDDPAYVTANSHVFSGLNWENVRWAFTSLEASNWHPLSWLSHMVDCQLFGLNPAGHHYDSLIFHGINVLLLFVVLRRATGHQWRSFYVSALFALHPVNVQSVAWVAERKNLLSTLFLFLAILSYGWFVQKPGWKRYLAVVAAFAASLMSKPMAVTFPFALLLLDYWPLGRLPDPRECGPSEEVNSHYAWWKRLAHLVVEKLPLFALAAASAWITVVAQARGGAMHRETPLPLLVRLGNAIFSYFEYVRITFWPARLGVFYPYPQLPAWSVAGSLVFVAGITVAVVAMRRRKYLLVGWFWFLGTLVPVIGLVQVGKQAMADRYAYIPLLGLFVIAVWLAEEAIHAAHLPRLATIAVAACVLLAAGVDTRVNLGYWQDSESVFDHASRVASRPDVMILINLGQAYFDKGMLDQALEQYRIAERVDPSSPAVHADIGAALLEKEQVLQAIEEFKTALRYGRKDPSVALGVFNNLGVIHLQQGQLEEAWNDYSAVLQVQPRYYPAMMGRAQARYRQKRYAEAEEELSHAIAIQPTPEAWSLLGSVLQDHGNRTMADRAFAQSRIMAGE